MGTSKKNEEEKRRGLDKRTPAQGAFEKMQEKRQMERILKKASQTHKQRVEDFNRHLDTLTGALRHSQSQLDQVAGPPQVPSGIKEEQKATSRLCLGPWYFLETFLCTHPCVFC
ncbi:protein FAM32A-like [Cervus canadensis]|uniref:protein FAM32A-like n=1 Tax=Cervus canadensis TaxID=1574408 RepID=UPI001C9E1D55|nr:protein FAM32A-like [Cervus canadensis]